MNIATARFSVIAGAAVLLATLVGCQKSPTATSLLPPGPAASVYDFRVQTADGQEVSLDAYRGKVLLIVNVASKCGFTPQYAGLEALYQKYHGQGLEILGFPCNQFKSQEPGTNAEIQQFCLLNYGVTFPVFAKIEVNGDGTHPLYQYLKQAAPGVVGSEGIKWNFTKFLIARDGTVVDRFGSSTKPEALADDIERLLGK